MPMVFAPPVLLKVRVAFLTLQLFLIHLVASSWPVLITEITGFAESLIAITVKI